MEKKAFLNFTYGIYLVTSGNAESKSGFIANSVFQVTSSPPQIAVSCHKNNHTLKTILDNRVFSVSVMKKDAPSSVIGTFGYLSGQEYDKFSGIKTMTGVTGAPVVTESALAWFDCRVNQTTDLGSHIFIVGEVLDCGICGEGEPLTYAWYREKYKLFSPKNSPTYLQITEQVPEKKELREPEGNIDREKGEFDPEPYICTICGHIYRPEEGEPTIGIPPGTSFSDVPEDFRCPVCNAGKEYYKPYPG